jgi:hypothetical protein
MLSVLPPSLQVKIQLTRSLCKSMVRRSGRSLHTDLPRALDLGAKKECMTFSFLGALSSACSTGHPR